jgi:hypothetical protein
MSDPGPICPYCKITLDPAAAEAHMREHAFAKRGVPPPIKPSYVVMGPTPLGQRHVGEKTRLTSRQWLALVLSLVFVIVVTLGGVFW